MSGKRVPDRGADLVAESGEIAKLQKLGPTKDELIQEFGADSYSEDQAKGEWRVAYRSPKYSQAENERRAARFREMYAARGAAETQAGIRRNAQVPTIPVKMRDGTVHAVPAHLEQQVANEDNGKPVIRWGRASQRWIRGQWYELRGNTWYLQNDADNEPEVA